MSSTALPPPSVRRRPLGRAALVLAATLAAHLWVLERARDQLEFDLPPPQQVVQAELFRLPAPILVAERAPAPRPARAARRTITPPPAPPPAPQAAPAEAAPLPEPAPAPAEPPATLPDSAVPAEAAADGAAVLPPLDAVMVGFPKYGRLVSDTTYIKGLLRVFGQTAIEWRIGADSYQAESVTSDSLERTLLTITSSGDVRPAVGVAPHRYVEQRAERAPVATNFQWEALPPKITFSASSAEFPLRDGVQDRLSFMAQLALLAQAFPDRFAPGQTVALEIAGVRDLRVYEMRVIGWEAIRTGVGIVDALKLERALPPAAREVRLELWLLPSLRWLPARTRTVLPRDEIIETVLREASFE